MFVSEYNSYLDS